MLSRLKPKTSHFRRFLSLSSKPYLCPQQHFPYSPNVPYFAPIPKYFSTNSSDDNNNNNDGKNSFSPRVWKDFGESEEKFDAFFAEESESLVGMNDVGEESTGAPGGNEDQWRLQEKGLDNEDEDSIFKGIDKETEEKVDDFTGNIGMGAEDTKQQWWLERKGLDNEDEDSIFKGIDKETEVKGHDFAGHIGIGAEDITPWSLKDEEGKDDLFNFQEDESQVGEFSVVESEKSEDAVKLEKEEQELTAILKGPNRAFGDMIAASGITDEMLDSLIALKDFEGVEGLPPLRVIEEMRYEKSTRKSTRAEIERLKQEEAAKARVREVDEKGRAYGTGRRKCSIARVWVQPGSGKFIVNDKEFDVYFPMLEHRAALLRPFSETKTLGIWDVSCTVKGGGVSGQVGAIRLGISKALQNWEPDLRPTLRNAGFLTRDSRVVERKKPGKAKARKSFQWVKR